MYNKKSKQNNHTALANCFNKKKTKEDDINRFNNIHKKITPIHHFNLEREKHIEADLPTEDIYKLNDIKLPTNISLNFDKEDYTSKIPKIHLKDITIPVQNEHDAFDLSNINSNISVPIHMNIFIGDEFNEQFKRNKYIYLGYIIIEL